MYNPARLYPLTAQLQTLQTLIVVDRAPGGVMPHFDTPAEPAFTMIMQTGSSCIPVRPAAVRLCFGSSARCKSALFWQSARSWQL